MRLAGKIALITGAGAGIGRACAELFAREGASIAVAELNADAGAAACQAVNNRGGQAIFIPTDVTKPESVEQAVARAVAAFGGLDILYNNVGGSTLNDGTVVSAPLEEFQRKVGTDLFGTWLGARYAVPEMIKRGGGSIINASSIVALRGSRNRAAYTAAKGGITALTRSMAMDLAEHNIRVNAIAPGSTQTERIRARRAAGHAGVGAGVGGSGRYLLGLLEPIDIAHAALYFASDESRRTTGQVLAVDSGFTIT